MAAIRNQTELGKLLGVTQQAVSKLVQHDEFPVKRRGPWSADEAGEIRQWHMGTQEDRAGANPQNADLAAAVKQMRVLLMKEQRATQQLKNQILRGQLVQRDMLDGALGGLTEQFLRMLDQIRITFPRKFGIESAALEREIAAMQRRLCEQAEYELRSVEDVVEKRRPKSKRAG